MKKPRNSQAASDIRSEYDFSGGVRGKHSRQYQRGHQVKINKTDGTTVIQHFKLEEGAVVLAPDVREYFSDSDTVNRALRTLIGLIPRKRGRSTEK
jgi:hypothetical protein